MKDSDRGGDPGLSGDPKCRLSCPQKRGAVLEVMTEAETGVMRPQAEVPWKLEEARKDTALQLLEGVCLPAPQSGPGGADAELLAPRSEHLGCFKPPRMNTGS